MAGELVIDLGPFISVRGNKRTSSGRITASGAIDFFKTGLEHVDFCHLTPAESDDVLVVLLRNTEGVTAEGDVQGTVAINNAGNDEEYHFYAEGR